MILLKKEDYVVSNWVGGTTRQLYIFPAESTVSNRDFLFRVSSADIANEKSEFSSFKGFSRLLLSLDNPLLIQHNDQDEKCLRPFEVEVFDGAWKTRSEGKCTDFNLIFDPKYHGELKVHRLKETEKFVFSRQPYEKFALLFLHTGNLHVEDGVLSTSESIVLEEEDFDIVTLVAQKESRIIVARIS